MKRLIEKQLKLWLDDSSRKPLILKGARQVGKTFTLKKFGQENFTKSHYFNFEEDSSLSSIFEKDLKSDRILKELSFVSGKDIDISKDLIIFDEIQECPKAITSLKYFEENYKTKAICAAGSLIGVKVSEESFPVGKVDYLWLGPFNFEEFLSGIEDQKGLDALLELKNLNQGSKVIHEYLWEKLCHFFVVGGMPASILAYSEKAEKLLEAFNAVRKIQQSLIRDYSADFSKHSGKINSIHIQGVFENIPQQLAKNLDLSTKRYKFKDVLKNKKSFSELEGPIQWLVNAGLVIKVYICNKAEIPLKSYTQPNRFKLYIFDIGLLGCMLDIPHSSLLAQDYGTTKGFFAENYVAQQLYRSEDTGLFSWEEGRAEIEFLRIIDGNIIPLEVKSGNSKRAKSLTSFKNRYSPEYVIKCRRKMLDINKGTGTYNYPLYMTEYIE